LRYWETKFPQLKPLQRAGNRRYYRPADVALARRIHRLLGQDGYTVRGVQKLLAEKRETEEAVTSPPSPAAPTPAVQHGGVSVSQLSALRDRLRDALGG
jgi:DNA-binding transcriptional MerR regulator